MAKHQSKTTSKPANSLLSATAYMRSTRTPYDLPKMEEIEAYRGKSVLIFAPHQDDEVLGCGGTIRRLVEVDAKVTVVYLTDGGRGSDMEQKGLADLRKEEAIAGLDVLGCRSHVFLGYDDGALAVNDESVCKVRSVLERHAPTAVFMTNIMDGPWDHIMTSILVTEALRGYHHDVWCLSYEIWNTIPFNCLVDISHVLELKMDAIRQHRSQMRMVDYSEKFRGLSIYRSLVSNGCSNCEAFLKLSREDQIRTKDILTKGFLPV